jgi:LmbE family N-acetylglucosaminyl deacetylase
MSTKIGVPSSPGAYDHPAAGAARHLRTTLPNARSVLAVVVRPGDEACYLGAVLEIFSRRGSEVGVLAFTRGDRSSDTDSPARLDSIRLFEFDAAASALRATHRVVVDYLESDLRRLPVERLAEHVTRMIREWSVDLIVTVDGRFTDRAAAAAACHAGREHDVPVLAWTLPHGVARRVVNAGGLMVTGDTERRIDFELRVHRKVQRSAMRAHRSLPHGDGAQLARLTVQGDREWLRWLVPAAAVPRAPRHVRRRPPEERPA